MDEGDRGSASPVEDVNQPAADELTDRYIAYHVHALYYN